MTRVPPISLSEDDFTLLMFALGIAAGAVSMDNPAQFKSFIKLANTINKDNPNWTPYEMDDIT